MTKPISCALEFENCEFVCLILFFNSSDDPEPVVEYDFNGVPLNELEMARALFETIGEVIGRSARATISLGSNFYALGGNSLNSIYTVAKLRDRGYCIEITNFISATNLREVLDYMTKMKDNDDDEQTCPSENKNKLIAIPLQMEHKEEVIQYVLIMIVLLHIDIVI